MHSAHLKSAWLWVLEGGLTLTFTGLGIAQETKVQEKPAVKDKEPTKEFLFPFTVSTETTRITEPLTADGLVDYAAALNARNSEGLKPEDNAGVLLMKAFGADTIPEANRELYFKAMGIAVPANEGLMRDLGQLVREDLESRGENGEDTDAYSPFWEQQGKATSRPWSRKEFPLVAKWVDANSEALKLAVAASQKPRLFFPLVPPENESLLTVTLESVQQMRELARLLTARAMLALEEGRIDDAQQDLLACHRLASLLGHRSTLIEALVSYALDAVACRADLAMAESDKVTKAQLATYRSKLAKLSPLPKISDCIDQGERFFALDVISHLATQKTVGEDFPLPNSKLIQQLMRLGIDWDHILKRFNEEYDGMAASLRLPTYAERAAAMDKLEEDLKALRRETKDPVQLALMVIGVNTPRKLVSRQMGNILIVLLIPAVTQSGNAEVRAVTRRDQTIIALALAEYKRDNGNYPETLSALSPKYLETLPQDGYTSQPLKYQRQDEGYLLYSQGPNGKDDKGQDRNAQNDADDWAIRVPIPPEL